MKDTILEKFIKIFLLLKRILRWDTKRILILAANPKDTGKIRFDIEVRKILEAIERSEYRDQIEIFSELAIGFSDFRRALFKRKPHIVHFIGHGNKDGIVLEDKNENADILPAETLSGLFELFSKTVKCVILNACNSSMYANEINKHINHVIGMEKEIEDRDAIAFAEGFYDALGAGMPIEDAFKFGKNAIRKKSYSPTEKSIPVLGKKTYHETAKEMAKEVPVNIISKKNQSQPLLRITLVITLSLVIAFLIFMFWGPGRKKTLPGPKTAMVEKKYPAHDGQNKAGNGDRYISNGRIAAGGSGGGLSGGPAAGPNGNSDKGSDGNVQPTGGIKNSKKAYLLEELKEKGLLKKLKDADAHCHGGSITGEDTALDLYREVIEKLSPASLQALDQTLLINAENNYINNNDTHALRNYNAVFKEVISGPNPPDATKRAAYLDVGTRTQSPNVEFDIKKHIVNLNARSPVPSGFWMEFRNDQITWADYDTIQLKVDYDEDTQFDQSAMLKLQLNGITLSPSSVKPNTIAKEPFLFKSKGIFYYRFKRDQLHENNFVTIALNKGQWTNFSIELTLIKKNETKK